MSEEKANELIAAITALSSLVSVIADDITAKNAAAEAAAKVEAEADRLREEADKKWEEADAAREEAVAAGMEAAADLCEEADAKYEEAAEKTKEAREIKEMRVRIDADGNYIEVEE